jgi:hypothetical protein
MADAAESCSPVLPRKRLAALIGLVASAAQCSPLWADTPPELFEITPFLGYRGGGSLDLESSDLDADVNAHASFAMAFDLRADGVTQYELFYARQESSLQAEPALDGMGLTVEHLQLGGTVVTTEKERFESYIVGGLGLTRFSLDAPGTDDDTRFSISFGGGLRLPVRAHFDVRLEARGYLAFLGSDTSMFCASGASGGACSLRGSGSAFFQYELLAGAAFRF